MIVDQVICWHPGTLLRELGKVTALLSDLAAVSGEEQQQQQQNFILARHIHPSQTQTHLRLQVSAYAGDAELEGALKGADLVVIPAGA